MIGRRSLGLMVAVSGTIWFLAGLYRFGPPAFPNEGIWFLNPLSWQFPVHHRPCSRDAMLKRGEGHCLARRC